MLTTTTILMWASLALAPQTPKTPTGGDDFFVGKGQTQTAPRDLAAWKREIARVQLVLEVDGQVKAARDQVLTLWDELGRSASFEGRPTVVLDALDLATRILVQAGERDRAAALIDPAKQPAALATDYAAIAGNARLATIRARVEDAAKPSGADVERIEKLVRDALDPGVGGDVRALGAAAAPALEKIVRGQPEFLGGEQQDALLLLASVARARA